MSYSLIAYHPIVSDSVFVYHADMVDMIEFFAQPGGWVLLENGIWTDSSADFWDVAPPMLSRNITDVIVADFTAGNYPPLPQEAYYVAA